MVNKEVGMAETMTRCWLIILKVNVHFEIVACTGGHTGDVIATDHWGN